MLLQTNGPVSLNGCHAEHILPSSSSSSSTISSTNNNSNTAAVTTAAEAIATAQSNSSPLPLHHTTSAAPSSITSSSSASSTPPVIRDVNGYLENIQEQLKEGYTVHTAKDGRLYYCKWVKEFFLRSSSNEWKMRPRQRGAEEKINKEKFSSFLWVRVRVESWVDDDDDDTDKTFAKVYKLSFQSSPLHWDSIWL